MTEKPKDFEDWYTCVFGGHITEEQASDELHVAYDYYVDNRKLTIENAELKEKLEIEQNARGDWFGKAVTKDRRLTEAKELLELFVQWNYGCCKEPDYKNLVKQAEQFLQECE